MGAVARALLCGPGHVPRVPSVAPQRLRELGRRQELPRQPTLSRPWLRAVAVDVDHLPHGTLRPAHVDDARPRLRALGHEPRGIPPHQPAHPLRQCCGAVLPGGEVPDLQCRATSRDGHQQGEHRRGLRAAFRHAGCRPLGAALRRPSATRGVRRVDHGATRCVVPLLCPALPSRIHQVGDLPAEPSVVLGLGTVLRLRAAVQGDRRHTPRRAPARERASAASLHGNRPPTGRHAIRGHRDPSVRRVVRGNGAAVDSRTASGRAASVEWQARSLGVQPLLLSLEDDRADRAFSAVRDAAGDRSVRRATWPATRRHCS